jgi:hypothetical protein
MSDLDMCIDGLVPFVSLEGLEAIIPFSSMAGAALVISTQYQDVERQE